MSEQEKHDGRLEGRNVYQARHILSIMPGQDSVRIGCEGTIGDALWLEPAQALALLEWLKQEEEYLKTLVEEASRRE